jgi:hypothetical protein
VQDSLRIIKRYKCWEKFFRVSLDKIKKVVQENHDKTVEFKNIPDAEQFRESEMIRRKINPKEI